MVPRCMCVPVCDSSIRLRATPLPCVSVERLACVDFPRESGRSRGDRRRPGGRPVRVVRLLLLGPILGGTARARVRAEACAVSDTRESTREVRDSGVSRIQRESECKTISQEAFLYNQLRPQRLHNRPPSRSRSSSVPGSDPSSLMHVRAWPWARGTTLVHKTQHSYGTDLIVGLTVKPNADEIVEGAPVQAPQPHEDCPLRSDHVGTCCARGARRHAPRAHSDFSRFDFSRCHILVARLRSVTRPTAAALSMISLVGLNWRVTPYSDAA